MPELKKLAACSCTGICAFRSVYLMSGKLVFFHQIFLIRQKFVKRQNADNMKAGFVVIGLKQAYANPDTFCPHCLAMVAEPERSQRMEESFLRMHFCHAFKICR
ncbi:MAG TPA: hypothetical protein VMR70_21665 [Flavisolibacter sp.]|nr:hypothetical protein [Flavisolibacter sp.]